MSQIKYVLASAKTLNFTKAAVNCNVSQPALTKAIKTLETQLGSPLFHREGKRIQLSEFGRSMLPHLQLIMEEADEVQSLADNVQLLNGVQVRLGVMSTVGHVRLSRFLAKYQKDYSGVEVSISEASLPELKTQLENGDLDLAILNPLDSLWEGFNKIELYRERYIVIIPPGHPLAEQNVIKLSDLSGLPYVDRLACEMREMVMGVSDEMGVKLYARFRSEREDWVQAMVLARIGFAFMPEYSVIFPELMQRPLIEPSLDRAISMINVAGRPFSPAVSALVRSAQSFGWPG
mgnify:CR=1 FL=1